EREESGRPRLAEAVGDDLVEPLMGLVSQRVGCRWTRRRGRATLTGAHGDRLRTVPVWDLLSSGQDKSPEPPPSASTANNGPSGALPGSPRSDERMLPLLSQELALMRGLQPYGLHPAQMAPAELAYRHCLRRRFLARRAV